MPGNHQRLGPSRSKRYVLCPGSVLREAEYQEEEAESPAAREGTRAHQLLEHCIDPMVLLRPKDVKELMDELGVWSPDPEMVENIQNVIDYLGMRQLQLMPSDLESEKRVNPEMYTGCLEQAGTADIIISSKHHRTLEVADLKYGRGLRVDPEDNTQLVLYAAGALAELDLDDYDEVVLTIMQPRIPTERGTNRSVTYTIPGLLAKAKEIGDAGNLALSGFGPIVPGDEQCRWCAARNNCEERRQHALTISGALFGDVSEKPPEQLEIELMATANTDPTTLDDQKLAAILDGIPALEAYCRDMKVEARRRLERGRAIPGYKLVQGKRSRAWAYHDEEDLRKFLRSCKVKVADYTATKLKGVAAIRTLVPEARRDKFDEMWAWQDGSPTVAHSTDERPAIDVAPVTFGPVETE